jgi:ketosteroid isomerase-like protein
MSEDNKSVVRRYLTEAFSAVRGSDIGATRAFLADDAVFHDPNQPPSVGHVAQEQRSQALVAAFPDAQFALEDLFAADDRGEGRAHGARKLRMEPA